MQNLVSNVKRPLECLKKMKELKSLTLGRFIGIKSTA